MSKLEKIGALWMKTSKKGVAFLSGKIGEQQVVVFGVKNKRSSRHPDYEIFKSEPMASQETAPETQEIQDVDVPF